MKQTLKPYADDETVLTVGDLVIENGTDSLSIHGDIEIRRDRKGLEAARILAKAFADAVRSLEAGDLPEEAPSGGDGGGTVRNPFA